MNLADKMATWRTLQTEADILADEIAEEVRERGKTQKIDGVTCSYSGGRKTYDYKAACADLPQETLDAYTKVIPEQRKVDYTKLCKENLIEVKVLSQTEPTALLKMTDMPVDVDTEIPM